VSQDDVSGELTMARERKRAGGLALVQARQSRLTAARERQRAAKSRRGFELI